MTDEQTITIPLAVAAPDIGRTVEWTPELRKAYSYFRGALARNAPGTGPALETLLGAIGEPPPPPPEWERLDENVEKLTDNGRTAYVVSRVGINVFWPDDRLNAERWIREGGA